LSSLSFFEECLDNLQAGGPPYRKESGNNRDGHGRCLTPHHEYDVDAELDGMGEKYVREEIAQVSQGPADHGPRHETDQAVQLADQGPPP
jgi:hypothetical protein